MNNSNNINIEEDEGDNNFSQAMGDLKGILKNEGISLTPELTNTTSRKTSKENVEANISHIYQNKPTNPAPKLSSNNRNFPADSQQQHSNNYNSIDDYIAEFENDDLELIGLGVTEQELEQTIQSIKKPEDIEIYAASDSQNKQVLKIKQILQHKMNLHIEQAVKQLKTQLTASMNKEIEHLFNQLS